MDEATNALDSVAADRILKCVSEMEDKTNILIAHNLETLRLVDCIYVIDDGAIVGQGSYDELSENNDIFRKLSAPYLAMGV